MARALVGADEATTLGLVNGLVANSLLTVDRSSRSTRFRYLDTLRSFALARLKESDARAAAHRRHIEHVAARSARVVSPLSSANLELADDIAAAFAWATTSGDPSLVRTMYAPYCSLLASNHRNEELHRIAELALEDDVTDIDRAHIYAALAIRPGSDMDVETVNRYAAAVDDLDVGAHAMGVLLHRILASLTTDPDTVAADLERMRAHLPQADFDMTTAVAALERNYRFAVFDLEGAAAPDDIGPSTEEGALWNASMRLLAAWVVKGAVLESFADVGAWAKAARSPDCRRTIVSIGIAADVQLAIALRSAALGDRQQTAVYLGNAIGWIHSLPTVPESLPGAFLLWLAAILLEFGDKTSATRAAEAARPGGPTSHTLAAVLDVLHGISIRVDDRWRDAPSEAVFLEHVTDALEPLGLTWH